MERNAKKAGYLATVAAVISIGFSGWQFGERFNEHNGIKVAQAIVLCAWILFPPMWFAWEYHKFEASPATPFERFKFGQDVASKVWLAIVTVLTILYFGKDLAR